MPLVPLEEELVLEVALLADFLIYKIFKVYQPLNCRYKTLLC